MNLHDTNEPIRVPYQSFRAWHRELLKSGRSIEYMTLGDRAKCYVVRLRAVKLEQKELIP